MGRGYAAYVQARKLVGRGAWPDWNALEARVQQAWDRAVALTVGEPDPIAETNQAAAQTQPDLVEEAFREILDHGEPRSAAAAEAEDEDLEEDDPGWTQS